MTTMELLLLLLNMLWLYLPYVVLLFSVVSFVPRFLDRIRHFAAADYQRNGRLYHRCYVPNNCCCHVLDAMATKPKQRKAVTRVYPKKQQQANIHGGSDGGGGGGSGGSAGGGGAGDGEIKINDGNAIAIGIACSSASTTMDGRRQIGSGGTTNHVNKIAKMFESGAAGRRVNRVPPTMAAVSTELTTTVERQPEPEPEPEPEMPTELSRSNDCCHERKLSDRIACCDLFENIENIENAAGLLNQATTTTPALPSSSSSSSSSSSLPPSLSMSQRSWDAMDTMATMLRRPQPLTPPFTLKTSVEDIFAAIARNAESNDSGCPACNCTLTRVTSIDDILMQRRLSRPLSAYSITDLLNDDN